MAFLFDEDGKEGEEKKGTITDIPSLVGIVRRIGWRGRGVMKKKLWTGEARAILTDILCDVFHACL